jgi:hypothetical protein
MRALSVRQPYAELILRGVKTIEYRSFTTRIIGERFHIYAAQKADPGQDDDPAAEARRIWSNDLAVPRSARRGTSADDGEPPPWMLELAARLISKDLPTGVIVGSAVIERCEEVRGQKSEVREQAGALLPLTSDLRPLTSLFAWHLTGVERAGRLLKPTGHPQPGWFRPF